MKDEYYELLVLPFLDIKTKEYEPLLKDISIYCKFNWRPYFNIVL